MHREDIMRLAFAGACITKKMMRSLRVFNILSENVPYPGLLLI